MKLGDLLLLASVLAVGYIAYKALQAKSTGAHLIKAGDATTLNPLNAAPAGGGYDALGFQVA